MPALPIKDPPRVFAEALAGIALVLGARSRHPRRWRRAARAAGDLGSPVERPEPAGRAGRTTLAGVLLAFPMVLAWTAAAPLGGRELAKPALVALLVLAGLLVRSLRPTGGWRCFCSSPSRSSFWPGRTLATRVPRASVRAPVRLLHRAWPGPLRQLRRDAWLGPVRTLWPLAVIALGVPVVLETLYPRRFLLLPLFQILALTVLPFFPFGIEASRVRAGRLFGGRFLRSWSATARAAREGRPCRLCPRPGRGGTRVAGALRARRPARGRLPAVGTACSSSCRRCSSAPGSSPARRWATGGEACWPCGCPWPASR